MDLREPPNTDNEELNEWIQDLYEWLKYPGKFETQSLKVGGNASIGGRVASETLTTAVVGPTDNLDVSGVNTVFLDCSGGNVTIGGFVGGVDGQILYIARL